MEMQSLIVSPIKPPVGNIATQRQPEADPIMSLDFPPGTLTCEELADCLNPMHG